MAQLQEIGRKLVILIKKDLGELEEKNDVLYGSKKKDLQLTEGSFDKIGKNGDRKVNEFFTSFKTIILKVFDSSI